MTSKGHGLHRLAFAAVPAAAGLRALAALTSLAALITLVASAARAQYAEPLTEEICRSTTSRDMSYQFMVQTPGWMAVASAALDVPQNAFIMAVPYPVPEAQPLNSSEIPNQTNILVRKHDGSSVWQYVKVYSTEAYHEGHLVDLDAGHGSLPLDTKVTRIYGGVSGTCGLVHVWSVSMTAGRAYRFTFSKTRPGDDVRLNLLLSGGRNGWLTRADALLDHAAADTSANIPTFDYTAAQTESYALVVFNNTISTQGGRYTVRVQEIIPPADPDLVVSGISPVAATAGQSVTASITVRNLGAAAAGASHTSLSKNGTTVCGSIATPPIAAFGQTSVTCVLGALTAGTYTLQAVADVSSEVNEGGNEGNNAGSSPLVVSAAPLPDLVVESIAPLQAPVGQVVNVSVVVRNQGGAAAGASNTTLVVDHTGWFGSVSTPALAPGESVTRAFPIGPFAAIGTHEVEACADADGVVTESHEGNNCSTEDLAIIGPDLYVVKIDPDSARSGSPITVSIQIRNQGLAPAGTSVTNLTVNGGLLAARILTPQIGVGQSQTVSYSLGSLRWNAYQLHALADAGGSQVESDETNNGRTEPLVVSPPHLVRVRADGSGDFATIQAAIDSVLPGSTIEVRGGTYTGAGNRDIDFHGKPLTLWHDLINDATPAVIDCQGSYSSQHRGFTFHTNETITSMVTGVTIRNGYATGGGGGIRCENASPSIQQCTIVNNLADIGHGGGIFCYNSSARIVECLLASNIAAGGQENPIDTFGGGLFCGGSLGNTSTVTVNRVTFVGNLATYAPAIGFGSGAAEVHNSIISQNTGYGGPVGSPPSPEGHVYLFCTDVYGNSGGDWVGTIAPQRTLNNNLNVDPLFCDAAGGNFTLHSDSVCLPGNNASCGQVGWPAAGCGLSGAHQWTVRPDGTGNYATIQAAIDASVNGDVILLTDGTFTGTGNRDLDTKGKRITIRSQSGNASACVVDCQGSSTTPHRGFYVHTGEDSTCVLQQFTIRNGWTSSNGAAISCLSAAPKIVGCVLESNRAVDGGAVMTQLGDLILESCLIRNNTATDAGAGMMAHTCSPQVRSCVFTSNTAPYGAAVYDYRSSSRLRDCAFSGGIAGTGGGAVGSADGASRTVARGCTFYGNSAAQGGALFVRDYSLMTIESCTFYGNSASVRGGAISVYNGATAAIGHSILWGNTSPSGAQLALYGTANSTLDCTDLQGGTAAVYNFNSSPVTWTNGLDTDPLFCSPGTGDFGLRGASPCAAANSPTCGQIGARPVGCARNIVVDPGRIGDYATIQQAIGASANGDVIELADGIYFGLGNRDLDFGGKRITLRSQSGNPAACLIVCGGSDGVPHRGFNFHSGEDSLSVVSGVTISGGWVTSYGAGILISNSSPKIDNCIIKNSHAGSTGGGLHAYLGSPVLRRTVFRGNSSGDAAGGLSLNTGAAIVQGCTFADNTANAGGGAFLYNASPAITGCVFVGNTAASTGGALQSRAAGSAPAINLCTFRDNTAATGGAIYNDQGADPTVSRCTLAGNGAVTGGGLYGTGSGTTTALDHTIIAFSSDGAAVDAVGGATATLTCCDLYGNIDGDWVGGAAGQGGISGNISANPLFCNAEAGELTIYPFSACAPAGNPSCGLIGAWSAIGCAITGVGDRPPETPRAVTLHPPVPNPFNPATTLRFELPHAGPVRLRIYDIAGRLVRRLIDGSRPAGNHEEIWDGRSDGGARVPSGVYFCRLESGGSAQTVKLALLK